VSLRIVVFRFRNALSGFQSFGINSSHFYSPNDDMVGATFGATVGSAAMAAGPPAAMAVAATTRAAALRRTRAASSFPWLGGFVELSFRGCHRAGMYRSVLLASSV
jgi:hypothetical protein